MLDINAYYLEQDISSTMFLLWCPPAPVIFLYFFFSRISFHLPRVQNPFLFHLKPSFRYCDYSERSRKTKAFLDLLKVGKRAVQMNQRKAVFCLKCLVTLIISKTAEAIVNVGKAIGVWVTFSFMWLLVEKSGNQVDQTQS